jgi:spermidine synthase
MYRWLTIGSDALQTVIHRYSPEKPGLYYLTALTLMARKFPDTSCLLGLGGGGAAHMLGSYNYGQKLIAVDSSDEIIAIAKEFFMLDRIHELTIIHKNASAFVQECTDSFAHIIVDLYNANTFSLECINDDFFINCKNRLNNDGFLAVNLANYNEQRTLVHLIKKHFKNTLIIPVKKCANMVVIASSLENNEVFLKKIRETGAIKKIDWMDNWGCIGIY